MFLTLLSRVIHGGALLDTMREARVILVPLHFSYHLLELRYFMSHLSYSSLSVPHFMGDQKLSGG